MPHNIVFVPSELNKADGRKLGVGVCVLQVFRISKYFVFISFKNRFEERKDIDKASTITDTFWPGAQSDFTVYITFSHIHISKETSASCLT